MDIRLNRDETGFYVMNLEPQFDDISHFGEEPPPLQVVITYSSVLESRIMESYAGGVKRSAGDLFYRVMNNLGDGRKTSGHDMRMLLLSLFNAVIFDLNRRFRGREERLIFRRVLVVPGDQLQDSHLSAKGYQKW